MQHFTQILPSVMTAKLTGSVVRTQGLAVSAAGFPAPVGAIVEIDRHGGAPIQGEVVGFENDLTLICPFNQLAGVHHGSRVRLIQSSRWLRVGDDLMGRIVDANGEPLDNLPTPALPFRVPLRNMAPSAISRPRISEPLTTGIRAIDGMLTCGSGQRVGIFAGSGVGKSVTLGMMARYTTADVNVIALIGERGREVNEFLERDLGEDGRKRSVVVVATSDQPALIRVQAAFAATSIAEYFRDQGNNVLLLMDSLTRFAMAQREIGLSAGEPPTTRGYPPSVFALLPQLVERAGRTPEGSITGMYTVLVEGDDTQEPISDTVRGLLDGHTVLSRRLAAAGHYPAIDVLESISRLLSDLGTPSQIAAAMTLREVLAAYQDHEDLISIGAYRPGTNAAVDAAVNLRDEIHAFLRQPVEEGSTVAQAVAQLEQLAAKIQSAKSTSSAATPATSTPAPAAVT